MLLVAYLMEIGALTADELGVAGLYSSDWFLHAGSERYLKGLMRYGTLTAERICRSDASPRPGDIALFKVVRSPVFNHGAVVTAWPLGVHAGRDGVREVNLATLPLTSFRRMALFDPFQEA